MKVQVAIHEVGLGGLWDATNVVPAPVVCNPVLIGGFMCSLVDSCSLWWMPVLIGGFLFLSVDFCSLCWMPVLMKVQVVILEVGLGGRWDATNVVPAPVVCGVTSLGYDHVELLGHTLALIAGEKAGIFKPNVPAFTSPQDPEAMESLERRANELQIPLTVVSPLDMLFNKLDPASGSDHLTLGLAGSHQVSGDPDVCVCVPNASTSVPACASHFNPPPCDHCILNSGNTQGTFGNIQGT
jgi:hypothetical protein